MPVCETTGYLTDTDILLREILRDRIFFEESGGGVTFSGGEPLHQPDFLAELLAKCRKEGVQTAVDTSGYATSEVMARVAPLADLFLYDLKILDECLHLKYTGVSNLQIKKNLVELVRQGIKVELRFPVIPGITDTPDNISQLREFLKTLYRLFIAEDRSYSDGCKQKENRPTLHLLPYHSMAKEKYRRFGLKNLLRGVDDLHPDDLVSLAATLKDTEFRIKTGG
jgi:pyruvate formate lyase activating enzyme